MIILHFDRLGLWDLKKKQFAGKWDQDPYPTPSGPSVEKQRQQMIKLRIRAAQKSFFLSQDEQIC